MDNISGLCNYTEKFPERLRLCAGCDKIETCCTGASIAADTFDLQQVSNGAMGDASKLGWMDLTFYRCWSEDQWHILPWGASESKATACHAWDLWRVLYFLARQCSCSPSAWVNQPSETSETPAFISPDLSPHNVTDLNRLTTEYGAKCSSGSSEFMTLMNWSSAWSMSGIVPSN